MQHLSCNGGGPHARSHSLLPCSHILDEAQSWLDSRLSRLHPATWTHDILCDPLIADADRLKIVTVMWSIWHSRNRWTHDREEINPMISIKRTRESLAHLELPRDQAKILPDHGWRPPEDGIVKITTDETICSESSKGGLGGVT